MAYSKRADLRFELERAVEQLRLAVQGLARGRRRSVRSVGRLDDQPWSVEERLGPAAVGSIVADSEAGTTKRRLAERYAISESSVKRLLRRHRPTNRLDDGV